MPSDYAPLALQPAPELRSNSAAHRSFAVQTQQNAQADDLIERHANSVPSCVLHQGLGGTQYLAAQVCQQSTPFAPCGRLDKGESQAGKISTPKFSSLASAG